MNIKLLTILILLLGATTVKAQDYRVSEAAQLQGKTIVFKFVADDDMFFIPYGGNGEKLAELQAAINYYKSAFANGQARLNVEGYSSGLATKEENLRSAAVRANRVKSELIIRCGIKEENFYTTTHATDYEEYKSVVVVTLHVAQIQPTAEERPQASKPERKPKRKPEPAPQTKPVTEAPTSEQPAPPDIHTKVLSRDSYHLAVRTNLMYDAMLLPTLGVEWRINPNIGVKVDGSRSWWGDKHGKVQKTWLVNPELRWYLLDAKRFYVGASANFGEYNIQKYLIGNMIDKDTGYQGKLWGAGLTVGYQLYLSRSFSLDFNLGLGYTNLEYDSFTISNRTRIYKDKDMSKDFWGPTGAGINLVWTIDGCK